MNILLLPQILMGLAGCTNEESPKQPTVQVDEAVKNFLKTSCETANKLYVLQVSEGKLFATHGYGTDNAHSHEVLDLTQDGNFSDVRWFMDTNASQNPVIKTNYKSEGENEVGEVPISFLFSLADSHDH